MSIDRPPAKWSFLAAAFILLNLFSPSPVRLKAQTAAAGNNAVYTGTTSPSVTFSTAYIDASAFAGSGTDFCVALNKALLAIPSGTVGAVIDARGLNSGNTTMACTNTTTTTPFTGITAPSTILLPAGTITINATWVLPNQTRITGAGKTNTNITVPTSPTPAPSPLIQMGSSSVCPSSGCTNVGVSDLRLDGLGSNSVAPVVSGIVNKNSQDGSFVSRVTLATIEGTALDIETSGANNSGPYADLNITAGGSCDMSGSTCTNNGCTGFGGFSCTKTGTCYCSSQAPTTTCVKILGTQTRGIHAFTCTAGYLDSITGNNGPNAGIYLDGNSNTVEDGHFEGVKDGIVVGDQLPTGQTTPISGNVVFNITGASNSGGTSGFQDNVVHICSTTSSNTPCSSSGSAADLSLSEIQSYTSNKNAILDDETSTTLTSNAAFATGVGAGIYILGESAAGGYSRFSTFSQPSPASSTIPVPTWGYADGAPPTGTNVCSIGSIFSNSTGTSTGTNTIYVCIGPAGSSQWLGVK